MSITGVFLFSFVLFCIGAIPHLAGACPESFFRRTYLLVMRFVLPLLCQECNHFVRTLEEIVPIPPNCITCISQRDLSMGGIESVSNAISPREKSLCVADPTERHEGVDNAFQVRLRQQSRR